MKHEGGFSDKFNGPFASGQDLTYALCRVDSM